MSGCKSCDLLRAALDSVEHDLALSTNAARHYRRDANQAWQVARAPDATLRLMVAELLQKVQELELAHDKLKHELRELQYLVEGEP